MIISDSFLLSGYVSLVVLIGLAPNCALLLPSMSSVGMHMCISKMLLTAHRDTGLPSRLPNLEAGAVSNGALLFHWLTHPP